MFKELFSTHGRLNRWQYVWRLIMAVLSAYAVEIYLERAGVGQRYFARQAILYHFIVLFPFVWMAIAFTVRRLHDMDFGPVHMVWLLTCLAPPFLAPNFKGLILLYIIAGAVLLWPLTTPSAERDNRYGKGPEKKAKSGPLNNPNRRIAGLK